MRVKSKLAILFLLMSFVLVCACDLYAQKNLMGNDRMNKEHGLVCMPLGFYTPETDFGGGVMFLSYAYPDSNEMTTKPNLIRGAAVYTTNNQMILTLKNERYFNGESNKLFADAMYRDSYSKYYGIGAYAEEKEPEAYYFQNLDLDLGFLWRLSETVYLGPAGTLQYYRIESLEEAGELEQLCLLEEGRGYQISGLGMQFTWDRRDHRFYPLQGFYMDARVEYFNNMLGSDSNYWKGKIDYRYFLQIQEKHVLAFQYYTVLIDQPISLLFMPAMGGPDMMRGYFLGEFRDQCYMAAQVEYRFPVVWRFGAVCFAGLGQVGPSLSEFALDKIEPTAGFGIRFALDKKQNVNFRFDFATNLQRFQPYGYLKISEAF